ncbi:MAG: TIGR01777 family oxidoreductase [Mycobacteriales bacterium]
MKIGVTGSSGFLGSALVPALRAAGHDVVRFVREPASAVEERRWDAVSLPPDALSDLDAVVHLSGAGVGDKRWSASYKRTILDSRVQSTRAVALAVAGAGTPVLLSASAIGYYGDGGDRELDEGAPAGSTFLADVCVQWEAATGPADATARVVHLRTGIVQARHGGALAKQLPVFKAGLGAPLGSGRQWVSWIALQDEVAAIVHLLTADVSGPVNLVAPAPVTNRDYTKALGRALHRPTLPVPVPGLVLRAGLGEFADEVLGGQRLTPRVLNDSGFAFSHPTLESALEAALADE